MTTEVTKVYPEQFYGKKTLLVWKSVRTGQRLCKQLFAMLPAHDT